MRKLVEQLRPIFLSSQGVIQKGRGIPIEGTCSRKVGKEKEKTAARKKTWGNIQVAVSEAKRALSRRDILVNSHKAEKKRTKNWDIL